MEPFIPILLLVGAYLLGSVPFSYLVVRLIKQDDIRDHGSGNVGATNVARTAGKRAGLLALLLDISKGWAAVALAKATVAASFWPLRYEQGSDWIQSPSFWIGAAALAAVLGHVFPLWLHFQGGKGVATAAGVYLALDTRVFLVSIAVFAVIVLATRFVSLGSILAAASIPVCFRFVFVATFWITVFATAIAVVVILKHHANIARLARGEERKFPR
jgi:glycerol-3-phosphate acyltransferase PlsY